MNDSEAAQQIAAILRSNPGVKVIAGADLDYRRKDRKGQIELHAEPEAVVIMNNFVCPGDEHSDDFPIIYVVTPGGEPQATMGGDTGIRYFRATLKGEGTP